MYSTLHVAYTYYMHVVEQQSVRKCTLECFWLVLEQSSIFYSRVSAVQCSVFLCSPSVRLQKSDGVVLKQPFTVEDGKIFHLLHRLTEMPHSQTPMCWTPTQTMALYVVTEQLFKCILGNTKLHLRVSLEQNPFNVFTCM